MRALLLALLVVVLPGCKGAPRPNILIFNIDMLRADHLGVYGYSRSTTPALDRVAYQGVWFSRARSQASWTYPSVVSLLTGLQPSSHGARYTQEGDRYYTNTLSPELRTLPMTLREHGYTTAAFITNPILKRFSGLARGFDVYRDEFVADWERDTEADEEKAWWLGAMSGENVHRALLAWLDEQPRPPVFLYVHYIDVHGPYLVPRPFGRPQMRVSHARAEKARILGKPERLAIDLYDGALRYLDGEIGTLLRELGRRGILDDSIVIITADHGEEFGEHDGHGHGHTLYEELLHVPLIIARTAAFPHTRRIDVPVAQVDVFPTLTDLLDLPPPSPTAGVSLRPLIEGRERAPAPSILSELDNRGRPTWNAGPEATDVAYALFVPPATKYIVWAPGLVADGAMRGRREEVYDLVADPEERSNLAHQRPETRALRALAIQRVGQAQAVAIAPGTAPIDAGTEERLRALGYVR